MVNNKAQMKIQQMAFMLIALAILFVLVGIFVLRFQFAGLREDAETLDEKNAMLLVSKLANSPEFSCEDSFGYGKSSCIDMDKLMALKENSAKYSGFWGVDNIEIRKIYPTGEEIECNIGNYPDCNVFRLRNTEISGSDMYNFLSLCYKEQKGDDFYNKCEIGRLMVFNEKE